MRLRKALTGCVLAIAFTSVSGCYDRVELEEQAFLISLGIDQAPKELIKLTARVAVPSKLSGTSGGGGGGSGGGSNDSESGTPLVSASGRTILEAISNMNTGIERTINLTHLSAVTFGDAAARKGLLPYLRTLVRYREFRRTLFVFVAKGELGDVFRKDKPVLETSITRTIEDWHESSERTGYAPSIQLHRFLGSLGTPNEDPVLPVLSVNQQVGKENPKEGGDPSHLRARSLSLTPGGVDRAGANPVECIGTAVFRGDKLVGILDGNESRYLQILTGSLRRAVISIGAPAGQGYLSFAVRYAEPITVKLKLAGKSPRLHIAQSFEAELIGDQAAMAFTTEAERRVVERALAARIKRDELHLIAKVYKGYRVEPFHYFSYARGSFPTFSSMRNYDWHSRLPSVQVTVETEVNLRRLGLQLNPPVNAST